jgi:hypothetical protein
MEDRPMMRSQSSSLARSTDVCRADRAVPDTVLYFVSAATFAAYSRNPR